MRVAMIDPLIQKDEAQNVTQVYVRKKYRKKGVREVEGVTNE